MSESPSVVGIGSKWRWLAPQPACSGEQVFVQWPANRAQGWRAVGGALFLTDTRLVFCPNQLEAWLGGHGWAGEVSAVDVCPRTGGLFDGGLVDRLRVRLGGNTVELFVIKNPPAVAQLLQTRALGAPGRGAGATRRQVPLRRRPNRTADGARGAQGAPIDPQTS